MNIMTLSDVVFYIKEGFYNDSSISTNLRGDVSCYITINRFLILTLNYNPLSSYKYRLSMTDDENYTEYQLLFKKDEFTYQYFEKTNSYLMSDFPIIRTEEEYFMQSTLHNIKYSLIELQKVARLYDFISELVITANNDDSEYLSGMKRSNHKLKKLLDGI